MTTQANRQHGHYHDSEEGNNRQIGRQLLLTTIGLYVETEDQHNDGSCDIEIVALTTGKVIGNDQGQGHGDDAENGAGECASLTQVDQAGGFRVQAAIPEKSQVLDHRGNVGRLLLFSFSWSFSYKLFLQGDATWPLWHFPWMSDRQTDARSESATLAQILRHNK
jgi:hypothetical protein